MIVARARDCSIAVTLALVAGGCSGNAQLVPLAKTNTQTPIRAAGSAAGQVQQYSTVRFRILVPGRTAPRALHRILPAYVSASTSKVVVVLRGQNQRKSSKQSFPCTSVCTGSIKAPVGVDAITLRLQDAARHTLSQGSATILVFKKKNNVLNLTFDGIPASVDLTPVPGTLPVVPASQGYVLFNARDADGNIITPDGDYTDTAGHTIVFDVASSNASFHLGVTTISGPGMPIPFAYDGTQHLGSVTLTPSAHPGVTASVVFHAATITLVPGIATRIAPPMPVSLLMATQVPMPGGSTGCGGAQCFDPNGLLFNGNAGGQQVGFVYDVAGGSYTLEKHNGGAGGIFVEPPIDLGGQGFFGYFLDGTNLYGYYNVVGSGAGYGGSANPCPSAFNVPIGEIGTTQYCTALFNPKVTDATHSTTVANGYPRTIRVINATPYFVTANVAPALQQVYTPSGGLTPVAGAISVGANVTISTTGYYGDSDGTVKAIGGGTVATFSHAVENVVGSGTSIYAFENGGIFGVAGPSGTFESALLPVGSVIEVVTGVGGVPMLVEQNGTLDVMAI